MNFTPVLAYTSDASSTHYSLLHEGLQDPDTVLERAVWPLKRQAVRAVAPPLTSVQEKHYNGAEPPKGQARGSTSCLTL